jgi:hypothetical protein
MSVIARGNTTVHDAGEAPTVIASVSRLDFGATFLGFLCFVGFVGFVGLRRQSIRKRA